MPVKLKLTNQSTEGIAEQTMYEVNAVKYNEKELELLIFLSKKHIKFNVSRFLLLTFFHFLSIVFSYFVANPIIFIMEGFSLKLLRNILFTSPDDPAFLMNFMMQIPFVISLYFMYKWEKAANEDPFNVVGINYWDYCHLITIILSRCINVGVKYGFYSDEHFQILRKIDLRKLFILEKLIIPMILNTNP